MKPEDFKVGPCTITETTKQVIDSQLLTALNDKSKVALLLEEKDLLLLIAALKLTTERMTFGSRKQAREMLADLEQLQRAAFPQYLPRK